MVREIDKFCSAAFALRVEPAQWLLRRALSWHAVGQSSSAIGGIIRSVEP